MKSTKKKRINSPKSSSWNMNKIYTFFNIQNRVSNSWINNKFVPLCFKTRCVRSNWRQCFYAGRKF
jgi:hypothetical protein